MRSLFLCVTVSACAPNLPDISTTVSPTAQNADFPKLQPLGPLLARTDDNAQPNAVADDLSARVAGLRQRAAALKGRSIIDGATRLRLLQAVSNRAQ